MAFSQSFGLRLARAAMFGWVMMVLATPAMLPLVDPDIWWVAAAGDWMRAHHAIIRENVFSYACPHEPWVMHEWLLGILYSYGFGAWGFGFLRALNALVAVATLWVFSEGILARTRHTWLHPLIMALTCAFFGARMLSPRPIAISLLLTVLVAHLSFRDRLSTPQSALLVAIGWLWAQCHGSFPLGWIIVAAPLFARPPAMRDVRRRWVLGLMVLSSLANPYGIRLWQLVASYQFGLSESQRILQAHVREFWPLWRLGSPATSLDYVGALGLLALCIYVAIAKNRRAGLVGLGLLYLGVSHMRNLESFAIVLLLWHVHDIESPTSETGEKWTNRYVLGAACVAGVTLGVVGGWRVESYGFRYASSQDVTEIVRTLQSPPKDTLETCNLPAHTHLMAPFTMTGAMLYFAQKGGSKFAVLYDARNDSYPANVMRDATNLDNEPMPQAWMSEALARYQVDWVIAKKGSYLHSALMQLPNAKVVHEFSGVTLYCLANNH